MVTWPMCIPSIYCASTLSAICQILIYTGTTDSAGLVPVNPARFQVLDVDDKCVIRDFVQRNGLIFKPGRGFYEFTKPEKVSDKKEVVLVDKVSNKI